MPKLDPKPNARVRTNARPKTHARVPYLHGGDSYFHIVLRSNRREALFTTPADRRALNETVTDALGRYHATLHAYCLLPNLFRALVQIDERLLTKILHRVVTRYSRHLRRQSHSSAPVFQRPYEAQRVENHIEFLNLVRFIHLSPVIANSIIAPADYRWSSHRAYLGYKSVAWINTDFGLSLLAPDRAQARNAYHLFMAEEPIADLAGTVTPDAQQSTDDALQAGNGIASAGITNAGIASPVTSNIAANRMHAEPLLPESRTRLSGLSMKALSRFVGKRKRSSTSRFLSIY